tara:strand:+ start:2668 stop:2904 length:237 start_codon:yes stop_codon:yes gene_type:complete
MIMPSTAHHAVRPLNVVSAVLMSAFLLSGCVTNDQYTQQICLDKDITDGSAGYSDCIATQTAWIEEDRRNNVRFRPND